MRDALTYNVKQALIKRGGFKEVVSRNTTGPIELELKFRDLKATSSLVTYSLIIDQVKNRPVIKREILKYRPKARGGEPRHFLDFSLGQGKVIADGHDKSQQQKLVSPDILALKMERLVEVGDLPGALWEQGFFEGAHPCAKC